MVLKVAYRQHANLETTNVRKGGHVIRTDSEGSTWEVVASGLRNPYGIDFNEDGEAFTYDADSERHVGLPWYRPTRMNHLVAGTDYGWRSRGELPWPIYHADILPPNVLIGRGSPTTVKFGYRSNFPTRYRRAFFAPDWAFGRVFAVHVVPRGASYSMHPETFLRRPPVQRSRHGLCTRWIDVLVDGWLQNEVRAVQTALYRTTLERTSPNRTRESTRRVFEEDAGVAAQIRGVSAY